MLDQQERFEYERACEIIDMAAAKSPELTLPKEVTLRALLYAIRKLLGTPELESVLEQAARVRRRYNDMCRELNRTEWILD